MKATRGRQWWPVRRTMLVGAVPALVGGRPDDPRRPDTFMSAVDQAGGGPARPWRRDTPHRRRMLAEREPA